MYDNKYPKPIKVVCVNCKKESIGLQDENGRTRIRCPHCGTITVSQVMGRRHVQLDVYAPKGQYIVQE